MKYPDVVDEWETMAAVVAGKSIARFGDGEFRLAMGGRENVSQTNHPTLRQELLHILQTPQEFCLVAIPRMDPEGAKWWYWQKYIESYPRVLSDRVKYYSAFISRPDSAKHIDVPTYYDLVERLWLGREVVLVRGTERSLVESKGPMQLAARTHTIFCPKRDAYADIDRVESEVLSLGVNRVLISAGAMATALAYRLARKGLHAIDIGHIGYGWRDHARRREKDMEQEIKRLDLAEGVRRPK